MRCVWKTHIQADRPQEKHFFAVTSLLACYLKTTDVLVVILSLGKFELNYLLPTLWALESNTQTIHCSLFFFLGDSVDYFQRGTVNWRSFNNINTNTNSNKKEKELKKIYLCLFLRVFNLWKHRKRKRAPVKCIGRLTINWNTNSAIDISGMN